MKLIKHLTVASLTMAVLAAPFAGLAADKPDATKKAVPDKLKICPVSEEKLGEMGDPYVFTYEGREVKLCCKNCLAKFKKDPAKYLKKIKAADKAKSDKAKTDK